VSEERKLYSTRPATFRLPPWVDEFLREESAAYGSTKTEVLITAVAEYRRSRLEQRMAEGYETLSGTLLEEVCAWDAGIGPGQVDSEWAWEADE
jgi:hypothetical protein